MKALKRKLKAIENMLENHKYLGMCTLELEARYRVESQNLKSIKNGNNHIVNYVRGDK